MTTTILQGDSLAVLRTLPDKSVQMCVTSPPYYHLRNYNVEGQIGLEETPVAYIEKLVEVFHELHRVLRDDGTFWLNIGDTYASSWPCNRRSQMGAGSLDNGKRQNRPPRMGGDLKEKDLIGIPWMLAFALRADGWYLRSDIIWTKASVMPESVKDRPTRSHEHVFLLTKSPKYYYDHVAIAEPATYPNDDRKGRAKPDHKRVPTDKIAAIRPRKSTFGGVKCSDTDTARSSQPGKPVILTETRNSRDVWKINTKPMKEAHFAVMPTELAARCIKAGTSERGCCSACGAPWRRMQRRTASDGRSVVLGAGERYASDDQGHLSDDRIKKDSGGIGRRGGFTGAIVLETEDAGWEPSCECDAPVVPCTVIDPFGGAGTTALAAENLGRSCTLIELNADYCEIARKRLATHGLPEFVTFSPT